MNERICCRILGILMCGCRQLVTSGRLWDALEELEKVSRKREVWMSLLRLLRQRPGTGYVAEDGRMDNSKDLLPLLK